MKRSPEPTHIPTDVVRAALDAGGLSPRRVEEFVRQMFVLMERDEAAITEALREAQSYSLD